MRLPIAFLLVAILLTTPAPTSAQTAKHPAAPAAKAKAPKPSALEHERELHRIRELHRAEYALSTREGRLGLARRLREEGRLLRAEAIAERYVYWHESARMAILAGDITLAWATIEEIEKRYAVSAFELKAAALEAAAATREPLPEPAKMANAAFLAFEDAKLTDPESARRLLIFAQGAAIEAKDTNLITLFASRSKDFQRTRQDIEEGKRAVADVAKSPDDAALNLKAGSYLCFARGDWSAGLPMLAKGSDDELSSLARADLERPTDSAARIAIADSWYGKSKGMTGALKIHALARACAWYREALPGLTGFTKMRIEKRLGELESVPVVPLDGAAQAANQPEMVVPKAGSAIENSIGMKLVYIPAGKFMMGSPAIELGRFADQGPQHEVKITKGYYLGKYPVTQAEYQKVMGTNPSWFAASGGDKARVAGLDTSRFPVERVSWEDAKEFCRRLSLKEGKAYRLPTEAEWEYACRAGTRTAYNVGATLSTREANFIDSKVARPVAVGSYAPNAWGLCDMHGNVFQWCADWYGPDYYANSPSRDPAGPENGSRRVPRGGSWNFPGERCRAAYRGNDPPSFVSNIIGLRVARSSDK